MKSLVSKFVCVLAVTVVAAASIPASAGLVGGNIVISGGGMWFPDVAYDSVDARYLVVWSDYNYSPQLVFGRFVSNSGSLIGNAFQISDGGSQDLCPAVAYNFELHVRGLSTNGYSAEPLSQWDKRECNLVVEEPGP